MIMFDRISSRLSFALAYYETLQDKLNQLKDAREALNALREEHLDQKQRQAVERERQRQLQLAIKLDDMRQKKQVSCMSSARQRQNEREDVYFSPRRT